MDDVRHPINPGSTRFMDRFRLFIRTRQLDYKTEKTYCYWVLYFIRHHSSRNPLDMSAVEVEQFLEHLATQRNVAPNTQKTALNALVFLYHKFLEKDLGQLRFSYSARPKLLPTVFTHPEAKCVIDLMRGTSRLGASMMYGSGLRVSEVARLRVQDIELDCGFIVGR